VNEEIPPAVLSSMASAYEQARSAYEAQQWTDTIKYSAQVLCGEPGHAAAFELLSTARRHLERLGSPAGEQRILSVVMCDLVDSTRLPRLIGREPYRNLLRDVQQLCASAVTRYEGRVAQYLGDGILAYFSYPQAHEDDPLRAALAALAIVEGIGQVRRQRGLLDAVDIAVRIGIDTGVVMVGAMGGGHWTTTDSIVGDPPNFAARLQAIAPPNGIIASEATYERIASFVHAKANRPRQFKGFDGRRRTYEVRSVTGPLELSDGAMRRSPLVGRDIERASLSSAWRSVLEGASCMVTLIGEAGMGKTRLAEELVNLVHATGGTHLTIRCSALHRRVPFYSVAAAVRRLLGGATASSLTLQEVRERASKVSGVSLDDEQAATLAELLGAPQQETQLPEQRRERALSVLVSLIKQIAADKRFLLLIDDLHDADPSTVELLQRIARANDSFAIVATARPDGGIGSSLPGGRFLEIGPLADDACRVLVERVLGPRPELIESVVARASGSPLFAEELAAWLERGQPVGSLPPALDLLLTARIDTVEPKLRYLLVTASVIGAELDVADLASLVDLPPDVTDQGLKELVAEGLLEHDAERPNTLRFRHALFREAAYHRLLPSERAWRHLRLAEKYKADRNAGRAIPAAIIAKHQLDGGAPARALDWWHRAALEARATAAHAEAVEHYDSAFGVLDALDQPGEKIAVELPLQLGFAGSASMIMGYTAERVVSAFERANVLAAAIPHSPERFTATMGLYTFALVTGQLTRAEQFVAQGFEDVTGHGLEGLEGTAYASQAYVRFFRGRVAEARTLCERAQHAQPTIGVPQDPSVVSRFLIGMIEWLGGDDSESERICTEAMRAANRLDGERAAFTRTFLLTYLAWKSQMANDSKAARDYATQAIALSQEHGFVQWLGAASLHLGVALCELGEISVGLDILDVSLAAWRGAGAGLMTPYFMARLALAKLRRGDPPAACELIDTAIALAERNDERMYLAELHRHRARCRLVRGDAREQVAASLKRALEIAESLGHRVFAGRALADLGQLDVRMAAPLLLLDVPPDAERTEPIVTN